QGVGEYQSLEIQLLAKQARGDGRRERRRQAQSFFQLGELDVRRHDGADAALNGGLEGRQLDGVQARAVEIDNRQFQVRVHARVAVARKMFRGRHDARILGPFDVGLGEFTDARGALAKRADVDDGV